MLGTDQKGFDGYKKEKDVCYRSGLSNIARLAFLVNEVRSL